VIIIELQKEVDRPGQAVRRHQAEAGQPARLPDGGRLELHEGLRRHRDAAADGRQPAHVRGGDRAAGARDPRGARRARARSAPGASPIVVGFPSSVPPRWCARPRDVRPLRGAAGRVAESSYFEGPGFVGLRRRRTWDDARPRRASPRSSCRSGCVRPRFTPTPGSRSWCATPAGVEHGLAAAAGDK
jgi:hypothetical protein